MADLAWLTCSQPVCESRLTDTGSLYAAAGVLHDDEDEDHFPPVVEAAGVLHDDEDEDHFSPVFEQATSEERPTGVSKVDKKPAPLVRCKVKAFVDKMNALEEERLKLLEDSPFYKLLEMSHNVQSNKAIDKLVSLFNTKDRSLLLPDGSRWVVIPQDFTSIMGVEDGDKVVIIPKKPVSKLPSEQTIIFFENKCQWVVSNKKIEFELAQSKDRDTVKRAFALFALRNIVCPPTRNSLCWAYLNHVDDLNGLKKKKWATHALNVLVRGINTYRNSRGPGRKNLGGCTIFLLLYARKKISDTIPEEIPEPRRTKMIDKKLDELLKMPNKVNERTDVFENARLVKNIIQQRNESMIIALQKEQKKHLSKVKDKKAKDFLMKDGEDVMFQIRSMLDTRMPIIDSILESAARSEEEGISQKRKAENELETDASEGKRKKTERKVIVPKHAMQTRSRRTRKPVGLLEVAVKGVIGLTAGGGLLLVAVEGVVDAIVLGSKVKNDFRIQGETR
ncbi:hypothetical protein CTI12_AA263220 [Artemisia annua]|uniref:Uncharacterized protein n=1 Tax=Artemisia annua TaxID=35608 RepID=A0A2U1MZV7_ARTAN|nr:hypothetical protein CTI12_AA263220 [Artemisia annua]